MTLPLAERKRRYTERRNNSDPRCAAPTDCRRAPRTVCCRKCQLAAYNSSPERKAAHSAKMKAISSHVAAKLHATAMRRVGATSQSEWEDYQSMLHKVGAKEARRILKDEQARQAAKAQGEGAR